MKDNDSFKLMRGRALLLLVPLSVAACSESKGDTAEPTVPTAAITTSTSAAPDVSVVPERIDEPYLNAVLAALDEIDGQATRIIVATKRFPPEAADLLNSIYSDEAFELEAEGWLDALGRDPELKEIPPNPGRRKSIVERVITASPECIWMAIRRDRSAVNVDPGPQRTEYLALQPIDQANDPRDTNPTPWMITFDGLRSDGSEPSSPCAS